MGLFQAMLSPNLNIGAVRGPVKMVGSFRDFTQSGKIGKKMLNLATIMC
jgi:hypothetical protein